MKLPTNYVCKQMTDVKLWLLYSHAGNHLTVKKKKKIEWAHSRLKYVSNKMYKQIISI